jgi:hypothetical protein
MIRKIFFGSIIVLFCAGSSFADTVIEYTLNGDWIYGADHPGTLILSDNPSGGISATINVPSYTDDGGLTASRHDLPGFSVSNDSYIELRYSSLTYEITGDSVDFDICLELEFSDSEYNSVQVAMVIGQENGSWFFFTWFSDGQNNEYESAEPIPPGLSLDKGSLGLYFHGNYVSPYFKDAENNITFPFLDWDLSQVAGPNSFSVDNDFEADTVSGGTFSGTVILEHVAYGLGAPPKNHISTPWIPLLLLDE